MSRAMRFLSANNFVGLVLAVILAFASSGIAYAQIPDPPVPARPLADYASVLTSGQAARLDSKLRAFSDTTSNQIVVIFTDDLGGYDIASYAIEIGNRWKVGQAEFDNGVVVVVKPKVGNVRGEAFIAVGYGLEGAIPDVVASRIVNSVMIPYFREGDYYSGTDEAVNYLMKLASGEISEKDINDDSSGSVAGIIFLIIMFILFVTMVGRIDRRNGGGNGTYSGRGHSSGPVIFMGGFGGSSGGGIGGGFGFGGGSFGGGGAGGSW